MQADSHINQHICNHNRFIIVCMATKSDTRTRRNKRRSFISFLLLAALLSGGAWYLLQWWQAEQAGFEHYAGFNTNIPRGYMLHGIDVSKHQGTIKWPAVKEMQDKDVRIGFAFIKATEGLGNVDKQFRRNWAKAKDAGLPRGAYHFFIPTKSGKAQALNFINTVRLQRGDLPPVLDIEQLYRAKPAQMRKEVKAWLQMVENAYGVKPILYTYVDFYAQYLGDEFADYPLWVAHYMQPEKPRIARDWLFWQHSETGFVNGIRTKVDFNVFKGDTTAFREILIP
jgi:lysozyme